MAESFKPLDFNSQQTQREYQEILTVDKNNYGRSKNNQQPKFQDAISEIIANLGSEKWESIDRNFSYLLNENQYEQGQRLVELAIQLIDSWVKHSDRTNLLQYFDYLMMICFSSSTQIKLEGCIQKIIENTLKLTLSFKWMANMDQKQKQQINFEEQRERYSKLVQKWELSIQTIRSFTFLSLSRGLNQGNWQHLWIFITIMVENSQISCLQKYNQQDSVLYRSIAAIIKDKIFIDNLMFPLFHNLSLLIRIFIIDINKFMSSNNELLKSNSLIPLTNNCSLVMKIIQYILGNEHCSNSNCIKLDCLMLLMTIMQSSFKKCQNYNQILQFTIRILLYLDEEQYPNNDLKIKEQQNWAGNSNRDLSAKQILSQISFYSGQLIGMIFFRNCEWLIQFCRKQGKQALLRTIRIFRRSVEKVIKRVQMLEQENIVYKRLVLGFCGILKINKFDTILENFTKQMAPYIIKIIEAQYGWQDEEEIDAPSNFSNNFSELTQCQLDEREAEWNQEYYNKHRLQSFEKVEEVDSFLQSVWTVKNHDNQEIFQSIMNNFDQKQAIVWIAQLERFQNKNSYDSEESD